MPIEFWCGEEHAHTHENFSRGAIMQQFRAKFEANKDTVFCVFNFSAGRDIDLAIFTRHSIVIVELKDYEGVIIGRENGPWKLRDGGVQIKGGASRNPFLQVRDNRNALRDLINRRKQDFLSPQKAHTSAFEHIDGILVFPTLRLDDSDIDIDRRRHRWFHMAGLSELAEHVSRIRTPSLELSEEEIRNLISKALGCEPLPDENSPHQQTHISVRRLVSNNEAHEAKGPRQPTPTIPSRPIVPPLPSSLSSSKEKPLGFGGLIFTRSFQAYHLESLLLDPKIPLW